MKYLTVLDLTVPDCSRFGTAPGDVQLHVQAEAGLLRSELHPSGAVVLGTQRLHLRAARTVRGEDGLQPDGPPVLRRPHDSPSAGDAYHR